MTVILRLWHLLLALWSRLLGKSRPYHACHVADAPDILENGLVYIVGADGYDWSALMRCPCGCGKTLEMNLLPSAKPVWQLTENSDRVVTLHPSVWLKTDCKSHFFLRAGHIQWV